MTVIVLMKIVILLIISLLCICCFGSVIAEKCNGSWCLRIRTFASPGEYTFVVENRAGTNQGWIPLSKYEQEEPIQERNAQRQIQIPSDELGYFWIGTTFGVSKDRGATWKLTDFEKESIHAKERVLLEIISATINEDGTGEVRFREHYLVGPQPVFSTKDFGFTWEEHSEAKEQMLNRSVGRR